MEATDIFFSLLCCYEASLISNGTHKAEAEESHTLVLWNILKPSSFNLPNVIIFNYCIFSMNIYSYKIISMVFA